MGGDAGWPAAAQSGIHGEPASVRHLRDAGVPQNFRIKLVPDSDREDLAT
jgi:hypothetical protein